MTVFISEYIFATLGPVDGFPEYVEYKNTNSSSIITN
jgi:hypothetical protein